MGDIVSSSGATITELLQNKEIVQLAIGVYQVVFGFVEDIALSVESCFRYVSDSETVEWRPREIQAAAKAAKLIGHTVVTAKENDDGSLQLSFSNGDLLTVVRTGDGFESYQVTGHGVTLVV